MTLIMDGLLLAAAAFAGLYCHVLARRLHALKNLDDGLGGAIVRMTKALEEARRALEDAKGANREGQKDLKELVTRAEAASGQLRILLAATRDLPEPKPRAGRPARRPAEETPDDDLACARGPAGPERSPLQAALSAPRIAAPQASAPEPVERLALQERPLRLRRGTTLPVPDPGTTEADILAALAEFADSGRL